MGILAPATDRLVAAVDTTLNQVVVRHQVRQRKYESALKIFNAKQAVGNQCPVSVCDRAIVFRLPDLAEELRCGRLK